MNTYRKKYFSLVYILAVISFIIFIYINTTKAYAEKPSEDTASSSTTTITGAAVATNVTNSTIATSDTNATNSATVNGDTTTTNNTSTPNKSNASDDNNATESTVQNSTRNAPVSINVYPNIITESADTYNYNDVGIATVEPTSKPSSKPTVIPSAHPADTSNQAPQGTAKPGATEEPDIITYPPTIAPSYKD